MRLPFLMKLSLSLLPITAAFAETSVYCPQKSGYINVGMTQDQVLAACGEPMNRQTSDRPITQKVPVTQLIYPTLNQGSPVYPQLNSAFYNQWSLPSGSRGTSLEIDVINDKVSSIHLNGRGTNAMSICGGSQPQSNGQTDLTGGGTIAVGSNINDVYNACGSPSYVNNTFIYQTVPSAHKPEIWIYQVNQYQSPYSLTFLDGKLQSID